jgi:hypothetical protein
MGIRMGVTGKIFRRASHQRASDNLLDRLGCRGIAR